MLIMAKKTHYGVKVSPFKQSKEKNYNKGISIENPSMRERGSGGEQCETFCQHMETVKSIEHVITFFTDWGQVLNMS